MSLLDDQAAPASAGQAHDANGDPALEATADESMGRDDDHNPFLGGLLDDEYEDDDDATDARAVDGEAISLEDLDVLDAIVDGRPNAGEVVVAQDGSADHRTVASAIKASARDSKLLIRPGVYTGSLRITKRLRLVGDGPAGSVVLKAAKGDACVVAASGVVLQNVVVESAREADSNALYVEAGSMVARDCSFQAHSAPAVHVRGRDSAARLVKCAVLDSPSDAIVVRDGVLDLVDCDVVGSGGAAIEARDATIIVSSSRIRRATEAGITVEQSSVSLSDSEVSDSGGVGVRVDGKASRLLMERTSVSASGHIGVWLLHGSTGRVIDCELTGNRLGGIQVQDLGAVELLRSSVTANQSHGVEVEDGARAEVARCRVEDNALHGISVSDAHSSLRAVDCTIVGNHRGGFSVRDGGSVSISGGEVRENGASGLTASGFKGSITARDLHVTDNLEDGLSITDGAGGEVTGCTFAGNDGTSIVVRDTRSPVVLSGNRTPAGDYEEVVIENAPNARQDGSPKG